MKFQKSSSIGAHFGCLKIFYGFRAQQMLRAGLSARASSVFYHLLPSLRCYRIGRFSSASTWKQSCMFLCGGTYDDTFPVISHTKKRALSLLQMTRCESEGQTQIS